MANYPLPVLTFESPRSVKGHVYIQVFELDGSLSDIFSAPFVCTPGDRLTVSIVKSLDKIFDNYGKKESL